MNKVSIFIAMSLVISSCSLYKLYKYNFREKCIEFTHQNALNRNILPKKYDKNIDHLIKNISRNTGAFIFGYSNDKDKPQGLCRDLYHAAQHENKKNKGASIPSYNALYLYKKHSGLYRNIYYRKMQSARPERNIEHKCIGLNEFIFLHKNDKINGTRGMDISDKKAYARKLTREYYVRTKSCNTKQRESYGTFNYVYNSIRGSLRIKTFPGCETFSRNVSKSALSSEIDGKNPMDNPIYRAFYSDYQQCFNIIKKTLKQ